MSEDKIDVLLPESMVNLIKEEKISPLEAVSWYLDRFERVAENMRTPE